MKTILYVLGFHLALLGYGSVGEAISVRSDTKLPFGVTPRYYDDYPPRFYLLDSEGFELAGGGFRYEDTNFTIKELLAYGYNRNSIVLKCLDSVKKVQYLVSYTTGYKGKNGNDDISFRNIDLSRVEKIKGDYTWVEVEVNREHRDDRFFLPVSLFLTLCLVFSTIFIYRRRTRQNVG